MNNLLNYILVVFFVSYIAIAQQLSGTITDADSGMPLPGATVLVKGSTNGTTTDFDGIFQLTNVSSNAILVISYIGYETQEIAVNNTTNFTIALSSAADALEEVVVVGYGTQRKKEVTGAVSVLGAKAIEKLNPVRTEQALQGQIAGVNITSQSGSPGAGLNIRIRGITTNGDNKPLILVDGNRIGDLNALNPNDIQSINVLKDATAGIYGVQASNGVILITTKSGRKNSELDLQIDSYTGFQHTSKKIELMNAFDFAQYVNDLRNKTEFFVYPQTGTDWQDEVFETASISEVNTTLKWSEKAAYTAGFGYLTQDGIVGGSNNNYERYNARINFQYDILDNLTLTTNALHFYSTKRNLPAERNGVLRIEDSRILAGDEFNIVRVADMAMAYSLIEEDLKEAIPNLPVKQDLPYEATKGAAQALLGKVYLYHGTLDGSKFSEAASVLGEVISSGQYSLVTGSDYTKLFEIEGENGSESVFEIQYNSLEPAGWTCITCSTGTYFPKFNGPRSPYDDPVFDAGWGFCLPSVELYDLFDAADARRDVTFYDLRNDQDRYSPSRDDTGLFNKKYLPRLEPKRAGSDPLNYDNNYRAIRYADVLLMAAEAEAQSGGANAEDYLNQVRARAYGDNSHDYDASEGSLLEAIYTERRKELAGEGHRFFDLVRTKKAAAAINGFTEKKNEIFPIPLVELELAPAQDRWKQNPGY